MLRDSSQHFLLSVERESGGCYTRQEVCRILKIQGRQLKTWERQQLIPEVAEYRFPDLLALKTIMRLRAEQCHPRAIRQALEALRTRLNEVAEPSGDVRVYKEGRRVRIQIGKHRMEPGSGQLLFDFADNEIQKLLQLPASQNNSTVLAGKIKDKLEADRWFERGLELEQTGGAYEDIVKAYRRAAELDPQSAGALVNLGTVYFNGRAWVDAEEQYRKALDVDPNYALAHFNLGNLYDERGDPARALYHYGEALKLQPGYADAHYNLALLHQGMKDVMGAVRHWRAYLKLDGNSAWAHIARRELAKLEAITVVKGSRSTASKVEIASENV